MKIAAFLGVKDERELLEPALAHLAAIGVDHVIASDSGSRDGSREYLASLVGPNFDLDDFDDMAADAASEAAATEAVVARARDVGADWLIFLDADEFPLPRGGSLKALSGLDGADVLELNRYNVPLLAQGPAIGLPPDPSRLDEVLLYAPDLSRPASQARVRKDPSVPWIEVIPSPKVMIRTAAVRGTAEGHHNAEGRKVIATDMVVAHVPFTTEARFTRKIANIERLVREVGDRWGPNSAWHWKRWLHNVALYGGAAGEMARNRITAAELAELRRAGIVRSAEELLSRA